MGDDPGPRHGPSRRTTRVKKELVSSGGSDNVNVANAGGGGGDGDGDRNAAPTKGEKRYDRIIDGCPRARLASFACTCRYVGDGSLTKSATAAV